MALSDIKAGDEITSSYLDECSVDRSRHSRQKVVQRENWLWMCRTSTSLFLFYFFQELTENYLFVCRCEKCEDQINDPDVTSDEDEEDMDEDD